MRCGSPAGLLVLYDGGCELCRRCRHWLEEQETYVPLTFLDAGSGAARHLFGGLPWLGSELVVVSPAGEVWVGPAAFLMALWSTRRWRLWSYRLSGPAFAPLAERFFEAISANRHRIASTLRPGRCDDGRCRHRRDEPRMWSPV